MSLACSDERGTANLNEVTFSGANAQFVEVEVLENDVSLAGWQLCYRSTNTEGCTPFGAGNFTIYPDGTLTDTFTSPYYSATWLVYPFPSPTPNNTYGEFVLLDSANEAVDYLRYCKDLDSNKCEEHWQVPETCGTVFEHGSSNIKDISRRTDGDGPWEETTNETEGATNTDPQPPEPGEAVAYYAMEEDQWGTVVDSSGSGNDGTAEGAAHTVSPGKEGCRAGRFPANDSNEVNAVDTGLDVDQDIGGQGTIAFWYKADGAWDNGRERYLFSGTSVSLFAIDPFRLVLGDDGSLRFELEDEDNREYELATATHSGRAGQWVHLAASWRVSPYYQSLKLYVDGSLVASETSAHAAGRLGGLDDLFVGDSAFDLLGVWSPPSAEGNIDEAYVFSEQLTDTQVGDLMGRSVPCEGQLDHIRIEHDGQALTCQPETILLKACADSACDSLYTDPVAVDLTSPVTGWDPDPVTLSGGQAEVNLRHTSAGTVSLDASATSPTADNATRCFVGGTESCQLTFHESGFIFDVPTQTACKPSADVTIQAVKESDDGVSCAPAFSGDRTVEFWSGYSDPAGGTESVFIDGNNDSNKAIAGSAPGTGIALTFDDNAEATFRVTYDDAGQVLLNARYDGSGDEAGLVLTGNDLFTGTPAGLAVYATEADNACPTADPADASCTPFKAAGESFDLNVKAACWSHAGDTDLSDNPATPNFELAGIGMDHTLIAPAGGSAGSIGVTGFDMTTADNGLKTLAQTVSEVGVFTFTATPPTYFGETIPAATSPRIGRFTPDHFEVGGFVEGQLEHGCNGTVFTYSGQAIDNGSGPYLTAPRFRITAMGPAGATVNYRDGFALLSAGDVAVSAPTEDADQLGADGTSPVTVTSSLATGTLVDNGPDTGADDGVLEYSASASDAFTYDHDANARVTPFTADLDLEITGIEDPDGVAATGLPRSMRATGTEIRFGRVAIYNAYGSELQALDLPLAVEHYQDLGGSDGFGVNSADTCTVLGTGDLGLNDHAGNLAPGDTSIAGVSLSAGEGTVTLSAPGDGNDGEVDVEAQLGPAGLPWLQYDWDDDGDYTDDPKDPEGHATFGIYGDDQNRIYLRERY